jgi:hypothetical protein
MSLLTGRMMATAIVTFACATPLLADEIWMTNRGQMQWEQSLSDMAVFNLYGDGVAPSELRLFLPGFQDTPEGERGTHIGFWTEESGETPCSAALVDPMGTTTYHWGVLELTFDQPQFPTSWTAQLGLCFERGGTQMRGITPWK